MLRQAQQKLADLALTNIEFEEADADEQQFQESQFDAILCSSAIVYLTDIPKALRQWHNALKAGGVVAFSCLAENSPTSSLFFPEVVQRYGGKFKRLWILKVCGTGNAEPRIEVRKGGISSILRRRVRSSATPRLHKYDSRLFSWQGS